MGTSWFQRHYFNLLKLHSLSGVVPVGLFLVYHFYTHSYSSRGPEVWETRLENLYARPFWTAFEVVCIYIPILFHAVLGVWISLKGRPRMPPAAGFGQLKYTLQRLSGLGLVAFLVGHIYKTRFSAAFLDVDLTWMHMREGLEHTLTFATYVLGIVAASFHLANGLWTFAIAWGLTVGPRAQKRSEVVSVGVFLLLVLVGFRAILGFLGEPHTG